MVNRAGSLEDSPSDLVDRCLDLLGAVNVRNETYKSLTDYAEELRGVENAAGVHNLIQMTASTVDYQFA